MFRTHPFLKTSLIFLSLGLGTACSKDSVNGDDVLITAPKGDKVIVPASTSEIKEQAGQPALAISTVASLISVQDVMVREPERFKKVLCSDSNIYDLDYSNGRFSIAAEPLSVCVLFADTKDLKPMGICGSDSCEATTVSDCSEAEKKELVKTFAVDQTVQRCWNVGTFPPLSFSVLMTRVGQSCQAQTLAKGPKGFMQLSTIDGTYETRKTAISEGTGCWWEGGNNFSFEGDWFGREKRVVPIMAFQKEGGLYALLRTNWSGSDNYQLFRFDGDRAVEVESFAEGFKDLPPEAIAPPPAPAVPSAPVKKGKGKSKGKKPKDEPRVQTPSEAVEAAPERAVDALPAPIEEPAETPPAPPAAAPASPQGEKPRAVPSVPNAGDELLPDRAPSDPAPPPTPEGDSGVSPLEGDP